MAHKFSVQFATNKRLATLRGHVVNFKPFEPKVVSEAIYRQAIAEGGIDGSVELTVKSEEAAQQAVAPADQNSEGGIGDVEGTGTDSGVLKVAQAAREIIDAADMDKLTSGNVPKLSALTVATGFEVNSALRDEAMKMVDEGVV